MEARGQGVLRVPCGPELCRKCGKNEFLTKYSRMGPRDDPNEANGDFWGIKGIQNGGQNRRKS